MRVPDIQEFIVCRHPACSILLISGLGSSIELLEEAFQKGHSFEIMSKPICPTDLLAKIKAVLAEEMPSRTVKTPVTQGDFSDINDCGI